MDVELGPVFSFPSDNFLSVWWCFGSLSVYRACSSSSPPQLPPPGTSVVALVPVPEGCLQ